MKSTQMKIAPLAGKGDGKHTRVHSNSTNAQRQRLLAALRIAPISTIEARRELDILMPSTRVHELRHKFGFNISKVWVMLPTDSSQLHRVALYILHPASGVIHD